MSILESIRLAFEWRELPALNNYTNSEQLTSDEQEELIKFTGRYWGDLTTNLLEENFGIVSWLSPYAFCYYLPGILSACILENQPNLIVNGSIVSMLDRTPNPDYWDDFFSLRWSLLTPCECRAVQEWFWWLTSIQDRGISDDSIMRSLETLDLLIARNKKGDRSI